MKNFLVFKVKSVPFNSDLLSGLLWDLNITGIGEYDGFLAVNAREDSGLSLEIIEQHLEKIKRLNLIDSYSVTEEYLKSKNWNEEWEKSANVIEVSEKFVIKPSFKNYNTPEKKIELIIDPKMSFGTGEHQTTKIMLQLLDGYMKKDDKVLDLGCGTGILGIAASKLGAGKITAVDNDEWCYLNTSENIKLNNILNISI
jgi:ribosomal protein L11 methyltransferase